MADELKPCPFCGSAPFLDNATLVRDAYYWVRCANQKCSVIPSGMQCLKKADAIEAWNTRPAPQPSEGDRTWRCFHCDEVFTSADAAREHFGSTELDEPGCKMLAKGEVELLRDYRDMAARWQRCVSENCDASRIYHSMSAKIATTEREAEQRGYDKGLNDARLAATQGAVPETAAARDVLAERERQKAAEGWTNARDDKEHNDGGLARAAACYAMHAGDHQNWPEDEYRAVPIPDSERYAEWPWSPEWWKPKTPRRDLVRAGALILAEIERLDRAAPAPEVKP